MKKIASIILMLLCVCSTNANPPWKKYVDFPSTDTYELSMNEIGEQPLCSQMWSKENRDLLRSWIKNDAAELKLYSLLSMISSGDEQAFRIGLEIKNCLDGHLLGDYYRASGLFFEQKPKEFFFLLEKQEILDKEFISVVATLPSAYVDQWGRKVNAVKKRIALILSISSTANSPIIEQALLYLKKDLAAFEKVPCSWYNQDAGQFPCTDDNTLPEK